MSIFYLYNLENPLLGSGWAAFCGVAAWTGLRRRCAREAPQILLQMQKVLVFHPDGFGGKADPGMYISIYI